MAESTDELLGGRALAFIGSGTMAEAMIQVLLDKGCIAPAHICASGPREERAQESGRRYGVVGTSAEAIYQLEKGGLRTVLSKAVWVAYQKSRLLGEAHTSSQGPEDGPVLDTGE